MALVVAKKKTPSGEYYRLMEVKRVRGKVVSRYVAYLGKTPKSKQEITPEQVYLYLRRMIDSGLTSEDADAILKRMGIAVDVTAIKKLIIENDLALRRLFLRVK
jgi:hypothetical protein